MARVYIGMVFNFRAFTYCALLTCMLFSAGFDIATDPEITLQKGIRGVLPCKIDEPVYAVYWSKGSTPSTAETIVMLDNYFNVGQRVGQGYEEGRFNISEDLSLVIEDVQVADEGRYFCEGSDITTGRNFLNHSDVTVYAIPERSDLLIKECAVDSAEQESTESCEVLTSTSVNLTCSISGFYPNISISFQHNLVEMDILKYGEGNNTDGTRNKSVTINAKPSHDPYVCLVVFDITGFGHNWSTVAVVSAEESDLTTPAILTEVMTEGDGNPNHSNWRITKSSKISLSLLIVGAVLLMVLITYKTLEIRKVNEQRVRDNEQRTHSSAGDQTEPAERETYISLETKAWTMPFETCEKGGGDLDHHLIIGTLGNSEVVIKNVFNMSRASLSIANIMSRKWTQTSNMDDKAHISCCRLLNESKIVCGTQNKGNILIFDRKWKFLDKICVIEQASHLVHETILVSVSKDGKIITAVYGGSTVSFFDPDKGTRLSAFNIQDGGKIQSVHALATGNIVFLLYYQNTNRMILNIIDQSGTVIHRFDDPDKDISRIDVDFIHDSIYTLYTDHSDNSRYKVDNVSTTGELIRGAILEIERPSPHSFAVCCDLEKLQIVTCDKQRLQVNELGNLDFHETVETPLVSETQYERTGSQVNLPETSEQSQRGFLIPKLSLKCKRITELIMMLLIFITAVTVIAILVKIRSDL